MQSKILFERIINKNLLFQELQKKFIVEIFHTIACFNYCFVDRGEQGDNAVRGTCVGQGSGD